MSWSRSGARRHIEAERALVDGVWHAQMTLQITPEGLLSALRPTSIRSERRPNAWVVPPAARFCDDRALFARDDGVATPRTIRNRLTVLLDAGFSDVGVLFDLDEGASQPSASMRDAVLFLTEANRLRMGLSYLGMFDLAKVVQRRSDEQTRPGNSYFDAEKFESQILAFEAVVHAICAAKQQSPLGWAQWVRLNPLDASSRAALTALRVRFAHLQTVLEIQLAPGDEAAEALYELLRIGVLDAQVTLYMPGHLLTSHQAVALAARGVRWTLSSERCPGSLLQQVKMGRHASLGLVIERIKHPLMVRPSDDGQLPSVSADERLPSAWPDTFFASDAILHALALPKRRLALHEPLAALIFENFVSPWGEGRPPGPRFDSAETTLRVVSFDSPRAAMRRLG